MIPDTSRLLFNSRTLCALRRSAREDGGATLIETALTMLIFVGLLFAVIEGCLAMYSYHYVANAAHEGARYAIVRGGSWTSTCDGSGGAGSGYGSSQCLASAQDIEQYASTRGYPAIAIDPSDVHVSYFSSVPTTVSTGCTDGTTTSNSPGDIVQVTICYPYTFALPGIGTYTYELSSTSEMVIAQ